MIRGIDRLRARRESLGLNGLLFVLLFAQNWFSVGIIKFILFSLPFHWHSLWQFTSYLSQELAHWILIASLREMLWRKERSERRGGACAWLHFEYLAGQRPEIISFILLAHSGSLSLAPMASKDKPQIRVSERHQRITTHLPIMIKTFLWKFWLWGAPWYVHLTFISFSLRQEVAIFLSITPLSYSPMPDT